MFFPLLVVMDAFNAPTRMRTKHAKYIPTLTFTGTTSPVNGCAQAVKRLTGAEVIRLAAYKLLFSFVNIIHQAFSLIPFSVGPIVGVI